MTDNTRLKNPDGTDGDLIADDEITDGGVASGAKVQRLKAGFGPDGSYVDVDASHPLPVEARTHYESATATAATDPDAPLIGPVDVATLASGVLRATTSADFATDGGTVSVWVGVRSDADPADAYTAVELEFPPTGLSAGSDPPGYDSAVYFGGSGAYEVLFPADAKYLTVWANNPGSIAAGSIGVDLLLRPIPYRRGVQHVAIDQGLAISSVTGTVPTVPAMDVSTGALTGAGQVASLSNSAVRAVQADITGTWAGTITFPFLMQDLATGAWVASTTANGSFVGVRSPLGNSFAVTASAWTSGEADVVISGWSAGAPVELATPFVNGAPVSTANPLPVTGGAGGGGGGSVTVTNFPAAQPVTDNGGTLSVDDGGGSLTVDGSVGITGAVTVNTHAVTASGAFPVTDNAGSLTVDDGGGSLTVDGTVNVGNLPSTQPVSGTVSVGNFPATQAVTGTMTIGGQSQELTNTNVTATGVVIAAIDVRGYTSFALMLTGGAGTFVVESSNDNTGLSFRPVPVSNMDGGTAAFGTVYPNGHTVTACPLGTGPVYGRYMRVRCTAITGSPISVTWELTSLSQPTPWAPQGAPTDSSLPVGPQVQAAGMVFNGAQWDRMRNPLTATNSTGAGIVASGVMGVNPSNQYTPAKIDGTAGGLWVAPQWYENQWFLNAAAQSGGSFDARSYARFSAQVAGTWSGTFKIQFSNEGATWYDYTTYSPSATGGAIPNPVGITANGMYFGVVAGRYIRALTTTWGSGSTNVYLELFSSAGEPYMAVDTELPAAAALTDTNANPTTAIAGAANLVWNGSNWARAATPAQVTGGTGTSLLAAGAVGFDGSVYRQVKTDTGGALNITRQAPSSSLTSVAGTTTASTSLLGTTNAATRKAVIIYNESSAVLYVALAAAATTTSYSYQVAPGGTLELRDPIYTGTITGVWSAAAGNARITELFG